MVVPHVDDEVTGRNTRYSRTVIDPQSHPFIRNRIEGIAGVRCKSDGALPTSTKCILEVAVKSSGVVVGDFTITNPQIQLGPQGRFANNIRRRTSRTKGSRIFSVLRHHRCVLSEKVAIAGWIERFAIVENTIPRPTKRCPDITRGEVLSR